MCVLCLQCIDPTYFYPLQGSDSSIMEAHGEFKKYVTQCVCVCVASPHFNYMVTKGKLLLLGTSY